MTPPACRSRRAPANSRGSSRPVRARRGGAASVPGPYRRACRRARPDPHDIVVEVGDFGPALAHLRAEQSRVPFAREDRIGVVVDHDAVFAPQQHDRHRRQQQEPGRRLQALRPAAIGPRLVLAQSNAPMSLPTWPPFFSQSAERSIAVLSRSTNACLVDRVRLVALCDPLFSATRMPSGGIGWTDDAMPKQQPHLAGFCSFVERPRKDYLSASDRLSIRSGPRTPRWLSFRPLTATPSGRRCRWAWKSKKPAPFHQGRTQASMDRDRRHAR